VACKAGQQNKLERLCRYITRPAISEQRLSTAANGNVIYALKMFGVGIFICVQRLLHVLDRP
jgi:hypothetical protein